jgi:hypothetical protein
LGIQIAIGVTWRGGGGNAPPQIFFQPRNSLFDYLIEQWQMKNINKKENEKPAFYGTNFPSFQI